VPVTRLVGVAAAVTAHNELERRPEVHAAPGHPPAVRISFHSRIS
jgi:hypothetical protein